MQRLNLARIARFSAIGLFSLGAASVDAVAGDADWMMYDVTVLTVASNGAWGTATREHTSAAIAAAIVDCRQRAAGIGITGSDCGARQVYARNGWLLAYACGERMFAVSGRTLPEAHAVAGAQEINWRKMHRLDIPACRLVVTIGPDGKPEVSGVASEVLPVIGGLPRAI